MSTLFEVARLPELQVVGWAVVHAAWQVALVGGFLVLLLRVTPGHRARARYGLAVAALGLMVAVPVATAFRTQALWAEHDRCWAVASAGAPVPATCVGHGLAGHVGSAGKTAPLSPARALSLRVTGVVGAVGLLWMVGAAGVLARRLGGLARAHRLRRRDTRPAPAATHDAIRRLSRSVGVRRNVAVRCSRRVDSPLVVGWLRPTILLPARGMPELTDEEMETVLAHELAHVRRGDYAANLLLSMAESLLFFHPIFAHAAGVARTEREFCCDDLVTGCSPHGVRTYLEALVKLDAARPFTGSAPALGAADGALLPRVRRLVEPDRHARPPRLLPALAVGLLTAIAAALLLDVEHPAGASAWAVMTADLRSRPAPPAPPAPVEHLTTGSPHR